MAESGVMKRFHFLSDDVKKSLKDIPQDQMWQSIAYSIACVMTGPTPMQPEEPPYNWSKRVLESEEEQRPKGLS